MPAAWPGFTAAMNSWFCGFAKGDTDEDWQAAGAPTAKKIADEYDLAIKTSAGPIQNLYASGYNKALCEIGFKTSFNTVFNAAGTPPEGIDLGIPPWIPAANGVIQGWLTATFQALPATGHGLAVLPLTGGPTDHALVDPGLAGLMPLAQSIHDAFHTQQCSAIASVLVSGFTQHMTLINGLYSGMMPNPTGTPPLIPQPPVPWVGVF